MIYVLFGLRVGRFWDINWSVVLCHVQMRGRVALLLNRTIGGQWEPRTISPGAFCYYDLLFSLSVAAPNSKDAHGELQCCTI